MAAVKYGLVRLLRVPVKTALFFLLLSFTVALVCAGVNLRKLCADNMARFEEIFTTIGTVEQKPEKIVQRARWRADRKTYQYVNEPVYGETVLPDVLDFEGAGYLSGPDQRACYMAQAPGCRLRDDDRGMWHFMIVEASPVEDCVPSDPVQMVLKRVLFSYYPISFPDFYYCAHFEENPEPLYADRTYIMELVLGLPHDWEVSENPIAGRFEYQPVDGPRSTQADAQGHLLPNSLSGDPVQELTPGFYDTFEGQAWLALCREYELSYDSLPVTATGDLNLIMAFYAKEAYVSEGEAFSEEDYRQGNRVCLVSDAFARRNKLKVGDSVPLALRYASYAQSASMMGSAGRLTAEGKAYEPFEEGEWQIRGIYDHTVSPGRSTGYLLEENEIFIPTASIKNSRENNIAEYGPMKGYTTAFQIPNGSESIENFRALWEAQGVSHMEITFYDGGFSQLDEGLDNMERMSVILLAAGVISAVCIVVFFCHLFITKQKRRTAVERCLGATKSQCVCSLLAGILVITFAGCLAGAAAGQFFAGRAAGQMLAVESRDTRYSNGAMQTEGEEEKAAYLTDVDIRVSAAAGGAVFLFTAAAALTGICCNLRQEPLELLAFAEKE